MSNRAGRRYEQQLDPSSAHEIHSGWHRSESGTRTPITRFAGAALTQNDRLAMRTTIAGMGVPVKRLELTPTDDGRQRLLVEVEVDGRSTIMTWFGHLEIEPQQPVSGRMLAWDLVLAATPGGPGEEWARFEVDPPPDREANDLVFGR